MSDFAEITKVLLKGAGDLQVLHTFPDGNTEARIVVGTPPVAGLAALETQAGFGGAWVGWDRPNDPTHDLLLDELVRLILGAR